MNRGRSALWRGLLWLSLGSWIGAWGFFAFVVSWLAFRVLPGPVAGDLAGSLLHVLHFAGAGAALVVAIALWALGQRGAVLALPILLATASVASELVISPEVASLRPSTLGAASTEETQTRFRLLHRISLGLFLAVHAASVGLLGWVAWLDPRGESDALRRRD